MKQVLTVVLILGLSLPIIAAGENGASKEVPDVESIVSKANIVAYYQGKDGKAKVKMTITSKQDQKRQREFNILRKDTEDGGDQKYFPRMSARWSLWFTSALIRIKMTTGGSICLPLTW